MSGRTGGLLVLVLALAGGAWWSFRALSQDRARAELCTAAAAGGADAALAAFAKLSPGARDGAAVDCLCLATLRSPARGACVDALAAAVPRDASYVPDAAVAAVALPALEEAGESDAAHELGRRARAAYPDDHTVYAAAVWARLAAADDVGAAAADEAARLPAGPRRARWGLALVDGLRKVGRPGLALEKLRALGPPDDDAAFNRWARAMIGLAGAVGDRQGLDDVLAHAARLSVPAEVAVALYAFERSQDLANLTDEDRAALFAALDVPDEVARGQSVFEAVFRRAISTRALQRREEEALALLDRARRLFPAFNLTAADVRRAAAQSGRFAGAGGPGTLRFVPPGPGRLRVADQDPVAPFVEQLAHGPVTVSRAVGATPVRWAWLDENGQTLRGGGSAWPVAGASVTVPIESRDKQPVSTYAPPPRRVADGRRRVVAVLLDSFDWAVLRYVEARGELPFLSWAIPRSRHGVLRCVPATTAASVKKLLYPGAEQAPTFATFLADHANQVGFALETDAGLSRPFSWLSPTREHLFTTLAKAGVTAVDLVPDFTAPGRPARAGLVHRPGQGPSPRVPDHQDPAALDIARVVPSFARWPAKHSHWGFETAAVFRRVDAAVADAGVDLVVAHVDPTDLASHNDLRPLDTGAQEADVSILRDLYRYVDHRLAHVYAQLDNDDVLLVFSDHGATSALAHSPRGVFILLGGPLDARGRQPDGDWSIDGLSWLLHRLVVPGAGPDWPTGGFAETGDRLPLLPPQGTTRP